MSLVCTDILCEVANLVSDNIRPFTTHFFGDNTYNFEKCQEMQIVQNITG